MKTKTNKWYIRGIQHNIYNEVRITATVSKDELLKTLVNARYAMMSDEGEDDSMFEKGWVFYLCDGGAGEVARHIKKVKANKPFLVEAGDAHYGCGPTEESALAKLGESFYIGAAKK